MLPQTIEYKGVDGVLKKIKDSNTYTISSDDMLWKEMRVPPCVLVKGLDERTLKFDFHKVYSDEGFAVKHCEYKNTDINASLIIYNQLFQTVNHDTENV